MNKMLSVIGSQNVGKTTIACQMGKYLSLSKKNTLVIFSDFNAPPLSYIAEDNEFEEQNSLSKIFSASEINKDIIKNSLSIIKNSEYLAFLGLKKGENKFSFPEIMETNVKKLFYECKSIFDYIILDCSNDFSILDTIGIAESDLTLNIKEQKLKSISFFKSFESIKQNYIKNSDKVVEIFNKYRKEEELHSMFNDTKYFLPYCFDVKEQLEQGKILKKLTSKEAENYKKEIKRIVEEMIL